MTQNFKTYVYVDGFNLYYGAIKGTKYHWLNLDKLFRHFLPKNDILKIKYFTALVRPKPNDPNEPLRQQSYLRALKTLAHLEVILGHYLIHEVNMPLANPEPGKSRYARVIKAEEKGSDVNLASHLLNDAHLNRFETAVVISNDSDLATPVRIVTQELKKGVGILNPHNHHPSRELHRNATFVKTIRSGPLQNSLFPNELEDKNGKFHIPKEWV